MKITKKKEEIDQEDLNNMNIITHPLQEYDNIYKNAIVYEVLNFMNKTIKKEVLNNMNIKEDSYIHDQDEDIKLNDVQLKIKELENNLFDINFNSSISMAINDQYDQIFFKYLSNENEKKTDITRSIKLFDFSKYIQKINKNYIINETEDYNEIIKKKSENFSEILQALENLYNCRIYLIGGFLREIIQNQENQEIITEIDIAFSRNFSKEEIKKVCKNIDINIVSDKIGYIKISFKKIIENKEVELHIEGLHTCHSIECESVYQLDYTINSLYYDCKNKKLIDPTGYGISDIKNKILSMPCPEYYSEFEYWIDGDKTTYTYRKLFRFFKFLAQKYKPSKNLNNFIEIYTNEKILKDKDLFLKSLDSFLED
jgi:cellobiose-specific phosphotransferase system component IIB